MNTLKRFFRKKRPAFSLGICIPVWNRGDLFAIAYDSLLTQLKGVEATVWIFDNGSERFTRDIIYDLPEHPTHNIIKTFLPENMGIPYVVNVFAKSIQESCDYTSYQSPQYVMIMDSDAYFKRPVVDLIEIMETHYGVGLVSGHDSLEHAAIDEMMLDVYGKRIPAKEKLNERMITMLMRKEEFLLNYPFPHFRNRDVDWEITQWNPNSMVKRMRKILVAPGYVLHLGIEKSTWNEAGNGFETEHEINEVKAILQSANINNCQKDK